jgi:tripartite-type tricarboxylate transporter receptor subunit TctC
MKLILATLFTLICHTAVAQQDSIRIIVPVAPGGGMDITARKLAPLLTKITNIPVVVENHPGGNTSIGTSIVAKSGQDSKTILISSVGALDSSTAEIANPPYDWQKDLRPVAIVTPLSPWVLVTSKKYTSFQQFKTALATQPVNFGTSTLAGNHVILMHMLLKATGNQHKDVQAILYKSSPAILNDVMSGQLDATFATAQSVYGLIAANKITALAVVSDKRIDYLSNTPTFKELGFAKFSVGSDYYGLWVSSSTPDSIVEELRNIVYSYAKPGGELHKEFTEIKFIDPHYQIPRNPDNEQTQSIRMIRSLRAEYIR